MRDVLKPTADPRWVIRHEGYNLLSESSVESRFALGNGFLGMRASRPVARGPTWVGWLGYIKWSSWPRCYVAGLFDTPNTDPPVPALVPVADWSRARFLLDGESPAGHQGEIACGGAPSRPAARAAVSHWRHRTPKGITIDGGDCACCHRPTALSVCRRCGSRSIATTSMSAGGQLRNGRAGHGTGAAGPGPWRLAHRRHRQGVAMTGAATLRARRRAACCHRPFSLRWV